MQVMPVADAIADAETLRINGNLGVPMFHTRIESARFALIFGYDEVGDFARDAARAAFRACPGLR